MSNGVRKTLHSSKGRSGCFKRKLRKEIDAMIGLIELSQSSVPNNDLEAHVRINTEEIHNFHDFCNTNEGETHVETNSEEMGVVDDFCDDNEMHVETISEEMRDVNLSDEFRFRIKEWAVNYKPTQAQLRGLLHACNSVLPFKLPQDPRTIMETPPTINIRSLNDSEHYWHNGFKKTLKTCLLQIPIDKLPSRISININIDGLPVFNSSSEQFWPILYNIKDFKKTISPQVVGIYTGKSEKQLFICKFSILSI